MRVALAVTEFPAVSQTFVLDHVAGLLARGHAVDIHARRPGKESAAHPEIERLGLPARTRYLPVPPYGRSAVWRDALRRAWRPLLCQPARLRALWRAGPRDEFWSRFYAALPFWAQGRDYQVLHAHSGQNGQRLLPLYAAGVLRAPLVVTFHGHDVHGYLRDRPADFYAPLFARAAALVVCSEFMRARLMALGAPAGKLHLIPNGIAPERYHWRLREAPQGRPVELLSVGRLVEFKGLKFLLSALAEPALAQRALRLQVVGDGACAFSAPSRARRCRL
jgi:colanic acid/amylovoran biosynthesis glycosyltransferase